MFLALGIVIVVYIVVSSVVVMTLSLPAIEANQGHVLVDAGRVIPGRLGFAVISLAAVLATASGVNATMCALALDARERRSALFRRRCRGHRSR